MDPADASVDDLQQAVDVFDRLTADLDQRSQSVDRRQAPLAANEQLFTGWLKLLVVKSAVSSVDNAIATTTAMTKFAKRSRICNINNSRPRRPGNIFSFFA